jgi:hypothetical protein
MKRKPNSRANRAIGWNRNRPALQPVADADMSRGESVSRQGKEHGPAFGWGLGGWTVRLSRTSAVPRLCNTGGKARRIRDHTKADRHGFVPHPLVICFGQPSLATSIGSRGPLRRLWLAGGRMSNVPSRAQTSICARCLRRLRRPTFLGRYNN